MDPKRFAGKVRKVEDLIPDGLSEEDVATELDEIRERLAQRRRESWVYIVVVLAILWIVLGGVSPLGFGIAVGVYLTTVVARFRAQGRNLDRLEARAAHVIEEARLRQLGEGPENT